MINLSAYRFQVHMDSSELDHLISTEKSASYIAARDDLYTTLSELLADPAGHPVYHPVLIQLRDALLKKKEEVTAP